jgi:hypothetical protein
MQTSFPFCNWLKFVLADHSFTKLTDIHWWQASLPLCLTVVLFGKMWLNLHTSVQAFVPLSVQDVLAQTR